jgi:hypothetical protein
MAVAFFRVRSVGRPVRASKRPGLFSPGRRRSQSIFTALRAGGSEGSAVLRSLAARHLAVHRLRHAAGHRVGDLARPVEAEAAADYVQGCPAYVTGTFKVLG